MRKSLSTRIEEIKRKDVGFTRNVKGCHIYKVHNELRDVNEKAYKPMLLAIGPYNDQANVGQGFIEEHKLRYLQQMLGITKGSVGEYIKALRKLEVSARKCYVECISQQTSEEFVEMMVLDGCFIIELFRKFEKMSHCGIMEDDPIFQMKWVLPSIARDLLLFENQLPFFVLAKLFSMSESTRSRNLREHVVDIHEEKDEISDESSTSTAQIIQTRLRDLALNFFSCFLPFQWNVDASSYNSTERIRHLLCLAHEAFTPSLPELVFQRLQFGFRFKNAEFEHLLGLIHATICISLLDKEVDAREHQEAGVKLKNVEIFKHLFGLICDPMIRLLEKMKNMRKAISYTSKFQNHRFQVSTAEIEDWTSIPYGSEFLEARVEFNMAKKLKDDLAEICSWTTIPYAIELQEAGIELDNAKKFKDLLVSNRNEDQKSKPCETGTQMDGVELKIVEKFKRLLHWTKIEKWKSIPYGKELQEAGVEFNKAKKFKCLLAHRNIKQWNMQSAIELEEAGIKFKKSNMFSIMFNNGLMEISPLSIEDDTETYLLNLIAYEQYDDRDVNYICNYVHFMAQLINSPKDVELLRQKGIISHFLGDDEIVSTMFNKFGRCIIFSTNIYARIPKDVNMHCSRRQNRLNRRWNVWMEKLWNDYFNSPWALVSFLGAVLLLALTITQTIFSIIH